MDAHPRFRTCVSQYAGSLASFCFSIPRSFNSSPMVYATMLIEAAFLGMSSESKRGPRGMDAFLATSV